MRTTGRPRVLSRAAGLAGTALMAAALLAWSPPAVTGWNQGSAEATLWQLMNGARVNNGRRALIQHSTLVSLARWRSKDQVQRDYFDHTILGTGYQVYHWYDLNGLQYSWGGENIGWNNGYSDADSPVAIHEGFMNSPGHRANILEPSFTHGGVGAYGADNVSFLGKVRNPRFYTELFMTAKSSSQPPPPPPGSTTPPPPPSGGGSAPSAPAPTSEPAALQRTDAPAPPQASAPLDGGKVVVAALHAEPVSAEKALAKVRAFDPFVPDTVQAAAGSPLRVQASSAGPAGLFETVLGSLLGFFL
ncbi:MAG TPA: CAP domain-containing protein [Candidatus Limnocylindrales bacterium]|nr:CAP domain-containing protein [Candidatus Limnocylindrales bacterium]